MNDRPRIDKRIVFTWLGLVLLTVLALGLVDAGLSGRAARFVGIAVIGLAALKVSLIGREFMELRAAPLGLRIAFAAWLLALAAVLSSQYALQIGP